MTSRFRWSIETLDRPFEPVLRERLQDDTLLGMSRRIVQSEGVEDAGGPLGSSFPDIVAMVWLVNLGASTMSPGSRVERGFAVLRRLCTAGASTMAWT